MIKIGKLPQSRWKEYRELRLESLRKDPLAFGSSYSEEINLSTRDWRRRTKTTLFAFVDGKPIGMIVFIFQTQLKIKHIANIYGFYVRKQYRSLGVGGKLIGSAISSIKKNKKIVKVNLHVNPKQKTALRLYKKFGFKKVGLLKKDLLIGGKFYDEMVMEKFV